MKAKSKKMGDIPSCIFRHFCIALLFLLTQKPNTGIFRIAGQEYGRRKDPTRITILKQPTTYIKNANFDIIARAFHSSRRKNALVGNKIRIGEDLLCREAQTQVSVF